MANKARMSPDQSLNAMEKASSSTSDNNLQFIHEGNIEAGEVVEIAPDVFWLRFALPFDGLDHINLYALKDGDGWVVVDTGIAARDVKEIWKKHFKGLMGERPVNRIIVTHLHPDHSGLAGWMKKKFDAPLLMTRGEYFLCRLLAADTGLQAPYEGITFYKKAGFSSDQIELYKSRFGGFGRVISPLPQNYDRLCDGDCLSINGKTWQIIVGSGHSPEHACLYCEELGVLLSGDQILPNISSNVSVWPTEPEADPLGKWIASCHKFKVAIAPDTLIAPAHGIPFRGVKYRLDKLIEHHEKALIRLTKYCEQPRLATEVYSVLFRRAINDQNRLMAVGESIAHLNCLKNRGIVRRILNDAGQFEYQTR